MYNIDILFTDLDGTALGNTESEAQLKEYCEKHEYDLEVVAVTGRDIPSVVEVLDRLPKLSFICAAVGTEIYGVVEGGIFPLEVLQWRVKAWDPGKVYDLAGHGMKRQDRKREPRYQCGFDWDGSPESLRTLRHRAQGLPFYVQIIPSAGKFVDVIPATRGKGACVKFLRELRKAKNVYVAGDSENDFLMFAQPDVYGIIPSNACKELKDFVGVNYLHCDLPNGSGVVQGLELFRSGYAMLDTARERLKKELGTL